MVDCILRIVSWMIIENHHALILDLTRQVNMIQKLHDEGMGYRKIAEWLNEHGYKTVRGRKFFNTHVFSILKKKRIRDERLNALPEDRFEITSPLRIEYVERKYINSD